MTKIIKEFAMRMYLEKIYFEQDSNINKKN